MNFSYKQRAGGDILNGVKTTASHRIRLVAWWATAGLLLSASLSIAAGPKRDNARPAPATRPVSIADLTQPEAVIFMLTRRMESLPAGETAAAIGKQILHYKALAHDLKRRVSNAWAGPDEFDRGRRGFLAYLAQGQEIARKIRRFSRSLTPKQRAENDALRKQAEIKLIPAARSWPDPLLRRFLLAVAAYQRKDYTQALEMFRRCCQVAPRVAAFWQGQAMALTGIGQYADALGCYNKVFKLRPHSIEAARLVRRAMRRLPGSQIGRSEFLEAVELVSQLRQTRRYRSRGISWLLPGGAVRVRDFGLPRPAYDRLVFKQAVGVPVADNVLMVDSAAVAGALEVFVRLGPDRVAPCKVQRRRGQASATPSLTLVSVDGHRPIRFVPLQIGPAGPAGGRQATAYTTSLFEQMGAGIRRIDAELVSVEPGDATASFPKHLAAGETTAPVITPAGNLVGFLAGKTDATAAGCGPDKFVPIAELADLLKSAARAERFSARRRERNVIPAKVDGRYFVVVGTFGERITKD